MNLRIRKIAPALRSHMRIVAWNCCRGPMQAKLDALAALSPDIAILSEAEQPPAVSDNVLWLPSYRSRLGIQVLALRGLKLSALPRNRVADDAGVFPVRVSGPTSFTLLATWIKPVPSYAKALRDGIGAYGDLIGTGPTVVAGDFNGNPALDGPRARTRWWSEMFAGLHAAGLVSAYHAFHCLSYGEERHPTHHFLRNPERPYHIDFCFLPAAWAQGVRAVRVLSDARWHSLSDHFPLIVDCEIHRGC